MRPQRASVRGVLVIGIFGEWRLANKLASQAEAIVLEGLLRMLNKEGPEPTEEEVANAKRLRAVANDLFAVGMKEMADRARSLRR
jgi:hypothetical protein